MTRGWLDVAEARAAELRMPEIVILPGAGPVLLVAPHPDDEVLGAGGTLRKHVEAGDAVSVVFVTDGARGGRGRGRPDELSAIRRREAEAACNSLGVSGVDFLGASDRSFCLDPGLVGALRAVIERRAPRLLYAPGFEERHRDHLLTAALVAEAWRQGGGEWTLCAYEVWTPLTPNCVVNVTAQFEHKRAAMRCHASQLEQLDYLGAMAGLAQYRAALIPAPNARFAEAFRRSTPAGYIGALFEFLNVGDPIGAASAAERTVHL